MGENDPVIEHRRIIRSYIWEYDPLLIGQGQADWPRPGKRAPFWKQRPRPVHGSFGLVFCLGIRYMYTCIGYCLQSFRLIPGQWSVKRTLRAMPTSSEAPNGAKFITRTPLDFLLAAVDC